MTETITTDITIDDNLVDQLQGIADKSYNGSLNKAINVILEKELK